ADGARGGRTAGGRRPRGLGAARPRQLRPPPAGRGVLRGGEAAPAASEKAPTTIFILALDGTAYTEELAALTNWLDDLLLPVYGREVTTSRPWCQQWQDHPEAVARLHALWLAWQQLTDVEAGLTGPSTWHRDHLDPTLLQLRTSDGPFGACTTSATRPNHRLLAFPQPPGA
ncbi:DUF4913 domain-containing protein, partial [Streptomyces sp. NPDC056983]|uniref:DUF4913 domain-containing protein n=1 Tax=Streptomyces sp. NPDC056983 TaxID=3345987 RepID=UPI0036251D7B